MAVRLLSPVIHIARCQMEDTPEVLHEQEKISLFRSIVGSGIYLFPQGGEGYVKKGESYWCLGTLLDSDWSWNKSNRKSTSGGFHALSSCPLFNSSRAQKSLSSCEAELRAIVSSAPDGIYKYTFAQFLSLRLGQRCTISPSQILQVRASLWWREELEKWGM